MQLYEASNIAVAICYKLQSYCNKINIAGSIRRKKATVGDIEIVCSPKKVPAGQSSLFDEVTELVSAKEFHNAVSQLGAIELGNPDGRQMKILLPEGIKLDLFMPQPHDYYRIYAIRTGSAQYSSLILATTWKRKGWVGTEHGLRRIEDCKEMAENKWKLINTKGELPPVWASEEKFFEWLGVKWVEPSIRDILSSYATNQQQNLLNHYQ